MHDQPIDRKIIPMRNRNDKTVEQTQETKAFAIEGYSSPTTHRSNEGGDAVFTAFVFVVAALIVLVCWYFATGSVNIWGITGALLVAILAACTIHVANSWESVVILRLGKYHRTAEAGLYLTIPFIEHVALKADQRMMLTGFGAEETLTLDLVPVNVDAAAYWMVWSPEKACTEVEDYYDAVSMAAQTILRDAIGRKQLSELINSREKLDEELKEALEGKVAEWGITIVSVEIRDIVIPKELQTRMAAEAVAERERSARMELVEVERDIADMLHEASAVYQDDEIAFKLRQMHLLNESVKDSRGSMVVPSSYANGFVDDEAAGGTETSSKE